MTPQEANHKLLEAANTGNIAAAKAAFAAGADIGASDANGQSARLLAHANGHDEMSRFLEKKWEDDVEKAAVRENRFAVGGAASVIIAATLWFPLGSRSTAIGIPDNRPPPNGRATARNDADAIEENANRARNANLERKRGGKSFKDMPRSWAHTAIQNKGTAPRGPK